ncbi:PHP domain-containing protein [Candidatus Jorgensenbacteria bacterium]|nr:PHP domain-containing protein [Candidatus Jorgensenbacteria bacterium]
MKLKCNIHFHTADDPQDRFITYTFAEGIAKAKELGFEAIALTCHNKFVNLTAYRDLALEHNILLIPGIERTIEGRHVVILNPDETIKAVSNFNELTEYKNSHPDIFIFAPHPFFYGNYSLKEKLGLYINLFDAIEYSWFYSKWLNRNKDAERAAQKYKLPFIATSDTHDLWCLDKSYAIIDAEEKTIPAIFRAIRQGKFENITSPQKFWRDMFWRVAIGWTLKNRKRDQ